MGLQSQTRLRDFHSLMVVLDPFVVIQLLSHVRLCNLMDCSMPGSSVLHYLPEFEQINVHWVGDAILSSHPLSPPCPPAFSLFASGSFSMSQLFASGGQSIAASASVLPVNIQSRLPLGLVGLFSLLSERFSRGISSTTIENIISSALSFLSDPAHTSVHHYWKNHSFDSMDFCQQNDDSVFQYAV